MSKPFVFAALLMLHATISALAMDCQDARTRDEKAICGDPKLAAQDAALSRFYFDTLRGLKGERHTLLIADQRRWLRDERANLCRVDDTPSARVACLAAGLAARQRALAICFADRTNGAAALVGRPIMTSDMCTVGFHPGCPKWIVSASAQLERYPWLVQSLVEEVKAQTKGADCTPESADAPDRTPDQNETSVDLTLLAERPGLVSMHYENNMMYRGAPHPMHGENILSYATRTQARIPVTPPWALGRHSSDQRRMPPLLPTLREGSKLLATINKAIDGKLLVPCCGDDEDQHTFAGIGLSPNEAVPDGWAVTADGGLLLGYGYSTLGRDFMATATLPRGVFIEAVDPRYAGFFVPSAKSEASH